MNSVNDPTIPLRGTKNKSDARQYANAKGSEIEKRDTHAATDNGIWESASFMAKQGFRVFPLKVKNKQPLFPGWQGLATDNIETVQEWAEKYPKCNYGILTEGSFFVLDFDLGEHDTIDAEIRKVQAKLGAFDIGTMIKTGRGNQLYCATKGFHIKNNYAKQLASTVDIKGEGGYVVGAGSIHPNGTRYTFCDSQTLINGVTLTVLSESALHYIASFQTKNNALRATDGKKDDADNIGAENAGNALDYEMPIPKGKRNDTLFRIGCYYREVKGLDSDEIFAILTLKNHDCDVPLDVSEIKAIAQSCGNYAEGQPRQLITEPANEKSFDSAVCDLFQDNRFVKLVRINVQKFHVGDHNVTELLMLSATSMSVKNTSGLQPKLSGESGKGKTHAAKSVLHLIDPCMYRAASFSSKALFYDKTLRPKTIIFSDDINLPDDTEEIVRKAMSNWDTTTEHITLDSQRNSTTLHLPARIVFWLTSVKTTSTIQLLNRQVEMNVDETPEQDHLVEQHQRMLSERGLPEFYIDDEVELLRGAFLHLNQIDFAVKIPFMEHIRFNDVSNRRNFPIFLDFIKAYCILNYRARETGNDDSLIAEREDFDNALELFKTIAVQQITKLNEKERRVTAIIKDRSPCDIEEIRDQLGLSFTYVYELIHGKHNSGNKGLLEKIPELLLYPKNEFNPETACRWGRNHYSLPKDWTVIDNFQSIVYWEEGDRDQLRTVSNSFAEDLRNSDECGESLNSSLGGVNGNIIHNTNNNFATSEEYETSKPPHPKSFASAPQRSCEIKLLESKQSLKKGLESDLDPQKAISLISEITSEKARNHSDEVELGFASQPKAGDHTATSEQGLSETQQASAYIQRGAQADYAHVTHRHWAPKMLHACKIFSDKWVNYVKMKMLSDASAFTGVDEKIYKLKEGDVVSLPESKAKALWEGKLADYAE